MRLKYTTEKYLFGTATYESDYLPHLSIPFPSVQAQKINCGFPLFSLLVARLMQSAVPSMYTVGYIRLPWQLGCQNYDMVQVSYTMGFSVDVLSYTLHPR